MRLGLVVALCAISAAIGAGIDHYWEDAVLLLRFKPSETVQTIKPSASEKKKVEVLGDRVRCDVRFTELGLPVSDTGRFLTNAWQVLRPLTDAEPVELITS
jgi:hypothetical protein